MANICIITSSYPLNARDAKAAAGMFVRDFALVLHELGHQVMVLTQRRSGAYEPDAGVRVCWYPWLGRHRPLARLQPWNPLHLPHLISLFVGGNYVLRRMIEEEHPDLIIAMWAVPAGFFALRAKRKHGIPYVTWVLGSDIWTYGRIPILKSFVRRFLTESHGLFGDGLALCRDTEQLAGLPCEFLPSARRLPDIASSRPLILSGRPNFLFIGRWERVKGLDVLLEAIRLFFQEGGEASFYIFGAGTMRGWLAEQVRELDPDGHRIYLGGKADRGMAAALLKAADCLIIPSRMESIPLVLSDAIQMGCPVIATQVGDMGRLLDEYGVGIKIPPDDADVLKRAMFRFLKHNRDTFLQGREQMLALFELKNTARRMLATIAQEGKWKTTS